MQKTLKTERLNTSEPMLNRAERALAVGNTRLAAQLLVDYLSRFPIDEWAVHELQRVRSLQTYHGAAALLLREAIKNSDAAARERSHSTKSRQPLVTSSSDTHSRMSAQSIENDDFLYIAETAREVECKRQYFEVMSNPKDVIPVEAEKHSDPEPLQSFHFGEKISIDFSSDEIEDASDSIPSS